MGVSENQRALFLRYVRQFPSAIYGVVISLWERELSPDAARQRNEIARAYLHEQNVRNVAPTKFRPRLQEQLKDDKRAVAFATTGTRFEKLAGLWLGSNPGSPVGVGSSLIDAAANSDALAVSSDEIDRALAVASGRQIDVMRAAVVALLATGRLGVAPAVSTEEPAEDEAREEGEGATVASETVTIESVRAMVASIALDDPGWGAVETLITEVRARAEEAAKFRERGAARTRLDALFEECFGKYAEVAGALGHEPLKLGNETSSVEEVEKLVTALRDAHAECERLDKIITDPATSLKDRNAAKRGDVEAQQAAGSAYDALSAVVNAPPVGGAEDDFGSWDDDMETDDPQEGTDHERRASGEAPTPAGGRVISITVNGNGRASLPPAPPSAPPPPPEPRFADEIATCGPSKAQIEPEVLLCLDFGTARSKAMAVRSDGRPVFLKVGIEPKSRYDYSVASSMWIDPTDDRIYFGDAAIEKSITTGQLRQARIDSLKHFLSVNVGGSIPDPEGYPLDFSFDSKRNGFSYGEILVLYLAYFIWSSESAIASSTALNAARRVLKRRFTMPSWDDTHRTAGERVLRNYLSRATLLARYMLARGREWKDGIPVEDARMLACSALSVPSEQLPQWLFAEALSEPLAAIGTRTDGLDEGSRLLVIVDVGAGTTDFGLFYVSPPSAPVHAARGRDAAHSERPPRFAEVSGHSVNCAGNDLDRCLHDLILRKLGQALGAAHAAVAIELSQRQRQLKEDLFKNRRLSHRFAAGPTVSVTLDEFRQEREVQSFSGMLADGVRTVLQKVEDAAGRGGESIDWEKTYSAIRLVATGGGAQLPMVQELYDSTVVVLRSDNSRTSVKLVHTDPVPPAVVEHGVPEDVYLPLAVAWGGAMPVLPTQRSAIQLRTIPRSSGGGPSKDLGSSLATSAAGRFDRDG